LGPEWNQVRATTKGSLVVAGVDFPVSRWEIRNRVRLSGTTVSKGVFTGTRKLTDAPR
jgi:hypothetical protein